MALNINHQANTLTITTDGFITIDEHTSSPATPASGNVVLYAKADGFLYSKDDVGAESQLGGAGAGQSSIQFKDEGSNLGTSGTATVVDFVGAGVTATRATNTVTVTISGGAGDPSRIHDTADTTFVDTDAVASNITGGLPASGNYSASTPLSLAPDLLQIAAANNTGSSVGGSLIVSTGNSSTGDGGSIDITTGNTSSGNNSVNGGYFSILTGTANTGGDGGNIFIESGFGDNRSGNIRILTGTANTGGDGGNIFIESGFGDNRSGNIRIVTGDGGLNGGNIVLETGQGITGNGGSVTITTQDGANNGGDIIITAGIGTTLTGGNIEIVAGFGGTTPGNFTEGVRGGFWVYDNTGFQSKMFILSATTTNATPTEMLLEANRRMTLPTDSAWAFEIHIIARRSNGDNESAEYMRKGAIDNNSTTVALVAAVQTIGTDIEDTAGWDIAVTADNTNKSLKIAVTGETSKTIRWVAYVRVVEVTE